MNELKITFNSGNDKYERTEVSPLSCNELIRIGDDCSEEKRYDEALYCYFEAVKKCDKEKQSAEYIYSRITKCNRKLKSPQDAIALFGFLVNADPQNVYKNIPLLVSVSAAYGDLSRWKDAKDMWEFAVKQNNGIVNEEMENLGMRIKKHL